MTWERVTLGSLIKPTSERAVPPDTTLLPYIGMEHVASQSGRILGRGAASEIKSSSPLVEPGDVLYGRLRPYLNKVAVASEAAYASGEFIVFRGNGRLDAKFLKWRLTAQDFVDFAVSLNTGDRPRVKWPQMAEFKLLLPPLEEQRRIVAILEDHLSRLDAAAASLEEVAHRTRMLAASSSGHLVAEAEKESAVEQLGAHAELVQYGTSAKCHIDALGRDVPVLRMGNIRDGRIDWSNLKYLPHGHPDFPKLLLRQGDLIFNRTNSAELVGKSAVVESEVLASFASYLIRVRFRKTVDPRWANLVINSPQGRAYIATCVSQQVGQANVNGKKLRAFPLVVPSIARQCELVNRHEEATEFGERVVHAVADLRIRSAVLRRSLLAAAFSGRLTGNPRSLSVAEGRMGA